MGVSSAAHKPELNPLSVHFVPAAIHTAMVSRSVVELQQLLEHR
jgi:hypothetical protein